jgi:LPS sulfotransferase NodH
MARRLFVILTLPRTGSYLLMDLLQQLRSISCHPEIFKKPRLELHPGYTPRLKWTRVLRDANPLEFIYGVSNVDDSLASGFKLMYNHQQVVQEHVLGTSEFQKIVLMRNPIARFISRLRAEATGQ